MSSGASIVTIHIGQAETDAEIAATFAVVRQLRPHLVEAEYVPLIRSLMASDGLRLTTVLEDGIVRAVAGWPLRCSIAAACCMSTT
jgi:hypothetical protein